MVLFVCGAMEPRCNPDVTDHNAAIYVAKYAALQVEQRRMLAAPQHRDQLRMLAGVELSGYEACAFVLTCAVHMECSHEKKW